MTNEPLPLAYAVETESADRRHVRRVMAWTLLVYAAFKGLPLAGYAVRLASRMSTTGAWPMIAEGPMLGLMFIGWALLGLGAAWLLRVDGSGPRAAIRVGLALYVVSNFVSLARLLGSVSGSMQGPQWGYQLLSMASYYGPDAVPLALSFALPPLRPRAER